MRLLDKTAYSNKIAGRSPLEKSLFAIGMLALCLLLPPWPTCPAIFTLATLATLLVARVSASDYLKALSIPLGFLLLSTSTLLFSVDFKGGLPKVALCLEALPDASRVLLRSLSSISCLLFLAMTTPLPELLSMMRRCKVPGPLIEAALLIYNWVFVLLETMENMVTAQESRLGYSTPKRSFHSLSLLASGLFIRSFERAKRLETGLAARGFNGDLRVMDRSAPASRAVMAGIILLLAATAILSILFKGPIS